MSSDSRVFAIGDIQGCLSPLERLLDQISFNPNNDKLWFCGDLINRGPQSLETLRYIKALGDSAICVLGNHDLHFLAIASGAGTPKSKDTFDEILAAPDRDDLCEWLRHCPLLHLDEELGYVMVHAGIYPGWRWNETLELAREAEAILRSPDHIVFFQGMYGNQPEKWDRSLQGLERTRFTINSLTRMRFCTEDLCLDLKHKGKPGQQPDGLQPWYEFMSLDNGGFEILFGHWSTLGALEKKGLIALDTGCIWGGKLSAFELNSRELFQLQCTKEMTPF